MVTSHEKLMLYVLVGIFIFLFLAILFVSIKKKKKIDSHQELGGEKNAEQSSVLNLAEKSTDLEDQQRKRLNEIFEKETLKTESLVASHEISNQPPERVQSADVEQEDLNKKETLAVKKLKDHSPQSNNLETELNDLNQGLLKERELESALEKTSQGFWGKLKNAFLNSQSDSQLKEQLEEILYESDLGPQVVDRLLSVIDELTKNEKKDMGVVKEKIYQESLKILNQALSPEDWSELNLKKKPTVVLVVGVNGAGKTTTIGKLADKAYGKGYKVLVAAGDTFRAAAQEQLKVWATRAQVEVYAPSHVKDPGAVAYEAIKKAESEGFDLVLIDTAGRLHTSHNLMEELKKIYRVIKSLSEGFPHEVLLVLDASGGQNSIIQAEQFNRVIPVTGVVLTKLDGTAKGGMALGVVDKLKVPIVWIGCGEKSKDLKIFDSGVFMKAILDIKD